MTAPDPCFFIHTTTDEVEAIAERWGVQAEYETATGDLVCVVPVLSAEYRAPMGEVAS